MEKMKFTPGPWAYELQKFNTHRGVHTVPNYYQITAGEGFHNGREDKESTSGFCITGYMNEADARLLHAGPILLEALQAIQGIDAFITDAKMKELFQSKVYPAIEKATL